MGLVAVGVAALVVYFSVKEVVGLHVSTPFVVLAWALVVAVGVVAARWWRAQLDMGLYDLILDEQARTLSLPPMHGRSERRDLGWHWSQSVVLEKQSRGGRSRKTLPTEYFCCVLRIGATHRRELVHEWAENQDPAANLVNWLQARLGLGESALIPAPVPAPVAKKKVRY